MFFLEALNFKTQFNNPFNWGTLSEKEIRKADLILKYLFIFSHLCDPPNVLMSREINKTRMKKWSSGVLK